MLRNLSVLILNMLGISVIVASTITSHYVISVLAIAALIIYNFGGYIVSYLILYIMSRRLSAALRNMQK